MNTLSNINSIFLGYLVMSHRGTVHLTLDTSEVCTLPSLQNWKKWCQTIKPSVIEVIWHHWFLTFFLHLMYSLIDV